ncbi:MAG: nitronate monooxygenase [Rhodospirillales bacterium]|nr:nitronate monooxygenase [Rhodospirillales bacterium]MBO6785331.1 nitronate monooxygenase [Rhodospirillales bacterium]
MSVDTLKANLTLPVIGAPMFLASGVDLVVAQCCAGIVGSFPALNARPAAELDNWLTEIESRLAAFQAETGKAPAPYAVNLIVHGSNPRVEEDLATLVRHKVPLVITSLSAPDKVVEAVHGYGGLVFHDVITVRHAEKAAGVGVDGLILVCAGAGGHAGRLSPFALLPEVKAFYDGAIVLSGAITGGAAILAAEALGADFAYIGSAFIATNESIAPEGHKQMVAESHAADVLYTPYFSGTHGNYLIPSILAAGADLDEASAAQPRKMEFGSGSSKTKAWKDVWSAGQGVGQIERIQPAADYIGQLKAEYDAARAALLVHGT